MGEHLASVCDEGAQQIVLGWSQLHLAARDSNQASGEVNGQFPGAEDGLARRGRGAAQCRTHARQQLTHTKWLGDVVISAGIQRRDLSRFLLLDGQNDDRRLRPLAHEPRDLNAIFVGQPQVQHDQIGTIANDSGQRLLTVGGLKHGVVVRRQRGVQKSTDGRLVIHHKHAQSTLAHRYTLPLPSAATAGPAETRGDPPRGRLVLPAPR